MQDPLLISFIFWWDTTTHVKQTCVVIKGRIKLLLWLLLLLLVRREEEPTCVSADRRGEANTGGFGSLWISNEFTMHDGLRWFLVNQLWSTQRFQDYLPAEITGRTKLLSELQAALMSSPHTTFICLQALQLLFGGGGRSAALGINLHCVWKCHGIKALPPISTRKIIDSVFVCVWYIAHFHCLYLLHSAHF